MTHTFNRTDPVVQQSQRLKAEEMEALHKRIDELETWKKGAEEVLDDLRLQEVAKLIGVPLGCAVAPRILPALQEYQERIAELEEELQTGSWKQLAQDHAELLGRYAMLENSAKAAERERIIDLLDTHYTVNGCGKLWLTRENLRAAFKSEEDL